MKLKIIKCENVIECEKYISLLDKGDLLLSLRSSKIPLSKIKDEVLYKYSLWKFNYRICYFLQLLIKRIEAAVTFQILEVIFIGRHSFRKEIELKDTLFETSLFAKVSAEVEENELY